MSDIKKDKYEIPEDEAAIVTSDNMTDLYMMIPKDEEMGNEVPELVVFLTAIFLRYHKDEQFVADQIAWFEKQQRDEEDGNTYLN